MRDRTPARPATPASALGRVLSPSIGLAKALAARLPSDAVHAGIPDDRYQAARSLREFAATLAPHHRVLDLAPMLGGCAVLLDSGAHSLTVVECDSRRRGWLQRHEHPGLDLRSALPAVDGDERFDLVLANQDLSAEWLAHAVKLLLPRGQLVLWSEAGASQGLSPSTAKALGEHFVTVQQLDHLGPTNYTISWKGRMPARARSAEYRIAPSDHEQDHDRPMIGPLWVGRNPRHLLPEGRPRLHIGSGNVKLEGWINVDLLPFPAVDVVLDVTTGLWFTDVEAVYAEHFLEHLQIDHALQFLSNVQSALGTEGVLRLSTPNVDWTWTTQYEPHEDPQGDAQVRQAALARAISLNRSFYGWEHRFLWNRGTLELALLATGFTDLQWHSYGQSDHESLRNIERHPPEADLPGRPHVLIVEGRKGTRQPAELEALLEHLREQFLAPVFRSPL